MNIGEHINEDTNYYDTWAVASIETPMAVLPTIPMIYGTQYHKVSSLPYVLTKIDDTTFVFDYTSGSQPGGHAKNLGGP